MKTLRVPEATITRLSVYSRFLEQLDRRGIITVSSGEIAQGVSVSPAQVRKDLAYFGEFGTRGIGYNVKDLVRNILRILGLDEAWPLILVGAGNLGLALCSYKGFNERGFSIVGVFDNDPAKIGKKIADLEIHHLSRMKEIIDANNVNVGIITVPSFAAQEITDLMVDSGLKAILNYAPVALSVPGYVELRNVDMSTRLEILTFNLRKKDEELNTIK